MCHWQIYKYVITLYCKFFGDTRQIEWDSYGGIDITECFINTSQLYIYEFLIHARGFVGDLYVATSVIDLSKLH